MIQAKDLDVGQKFIHVGEDESNVENLDSFECLFLWEVMAQGRKGGETLAKPVFDNGMQMEEFAFEDYVILIH